MPESLDGLEKVVYRGKANATLAERAAAYDFRLQIGLIPKIEGLPDPYLPARANEALPLVRIVGDLPSQENLDPSLKKLAGRRVARAERLCLGASAAAVQPSRKYAGVVEHHEIVGTQKAGEVAERQVLEADGLAVEVKHARSSAVGQRFLGDLRFGKVVVEVGDEQAASIIGLASRPFERNVAYGGNSAEKT